MQMKAAVSLGIYRIHTFETSFSTFCIDSKAFNVFSNVYCIGRVSGWDGSPQAGRLLSSKGGRQAAQRLRRRLLLLLLLKSILWCVIFSILFLPPSRRPCYWTDFPPNQPTTNPFDVPAQPSRLCKTKRLTAFSSSVWVFMGELLRQEEKGFDEAANPF
uniref:G_PROTEIN_RECEP_F1_2 domain-containing protein n=1 Tax=Panagrellus redivivus TaxID=6233 RepID=A0A7E4W3D3_PANRE